MLLKECGILTCKYVYRHLCTSSFTHLQMHVAVIHIRLIFNVPTIKVSIPHWDKLNQLLAPVYYLTFQTNPYFLISTATLYTYLLICIGLVCTYWLYFIAAQVIYFKCSTNYIHNHVSMILSMLFYI